MTSSNWSVVESELGGNGQFSSSSTDYSINPSTDDGGSSLGEAAVGNSSSTSYQSNSGFNTTAQPGLIFAVNTSSVNLGTLATGSAATSTGTFSVRDYTSSGYNVYMVGTSPTYNGHPLTALTTDTAWTSNTEEFGVNTVSNSTVSGSANATCQAAGFCFGVSGDGSTNHYIQTNKFRFNSNEVVASGPKSSGETDYTMSFMAGISTVTPGGIYQGNIALIATGSY
jgi:hypothetical protein